jgi:hypothetical protein
MRSGFNIFGLRGQSGEVQSDVLLKSVAWAAPSRHRPHSSSASHVRLGRWGCVAYSIIRRAMVSTPGRMVSPSVAAEVATTGGIP